MKPPCLEEEGGRGPDRLTGGARREREIFISTGEAGGDKATLTHLLQAKGREPRGRGKNR